MNILTFDIEEWFHILDHTSTKTENEWNNYESRIHQNMERIFTILETHKVSATFFCLGWIAKKYPEVIQQIIERGYEIGSHTQMHQLVYEQSPQAFKTDVEKSIKILEDISGKKVKYFRAPGFSITEETKWAFEVLVDFGIEIDASIFPAQRGHGGFPSYSQPVPSLLHYNGLSIKELPINYASMAGKSMIFSGGGYFRLLPYIFVKRWTRSSEYVMTYFHPRDFDAGQPLIPNLPLHRRFKSYVGLRQAEKKLGKWLNDFAFIDIAEADRKIDWTQVPVVKI